VKQWRTLAGLLGEERLAGLMLLFTEVQPVLRKTGVGAHPVGRSAPFSFPEGQTAGWHKRLHVSVRASQRTFSRDKTLPIT